jgi:hypothetical protein
MTVTGKLDYNASDQAIVSATYFYRLSGSNLLRENYVGKRSLCISVFRQNPNLTLDSGVCSPNLNFFGCRIEDRCAGQTPLFFRRERPGKKQAAAF